MNMKFIHYITLISMLLLCCNKNTSREDFGISGADPLSSKDASTDVDIGACHVGFAACEAPCLNSTLNTSSRKECLNTCVYKFRVCTQCPLVD